VRVFVTGASGALGSRLVPELIDAGHEVIGTHHSASSAELLRTLGAKPVKLDLLDANAVREAVIETEPDAIVHEATALADAKFGRDFDRECAMTNELRTKGTDVLLAAARAAGTGRFGAQSFASYRNAREGGPIKTEDDPLDLTPPANAQQSFAAMGRAGGHRVRRHRAALRRVLRRRERRADRAGAQAAIRLSATGAVSRRGSTSTTPSRHRARAGARRTGCLQHRGRRAGAGPGWLPVLAQAAGAKPPRHAPAWLARLLAGEAAVVMSTEARGASNAKAKRELGWTPHHPTWRTGFKSAYSTIAVADGPEPHRPSRTASHSTG